MENRCYDPDCNNTSCFNPAHFNFICFDSKCDDPHCEIKEHYNKELLKEFQKNNDLSIYDHREEIDYNADVDISICGCPDCADDDHNKNNKHEHSHDTESCNDSECHEEHHDHKHSHDTESCNDSECHEEHHDHKHSHDTDSCNDSECHEEHHDHEHSHENTNSCSDSDCECHDNDNIDKSNTSNDDEEPEEELLAEGKPLIYNRPIQIILSSGILFGLGHLLEFLSFNTNIINGIFILSAIIAGYQIAISAYKSLVNRHTIGPSLLMCIACIASFIIGHPEEGAAVTFLYFIAEFLEDYSEHRAKHSIKSLVEIAPETATIKKGETEEIKKVDDVNIGEIVIVKPGDKIPLDGNIISGTSSINQASITGESLPVNKEIGDEVFSGTVNQDGYLEIVVTKKAKDSVISKIVTLVKSSQLHRSQTESMVDKVAKYYTPMMILMTACVAFIPPILFAQDWNQWVYRALSLLVISCPCAFLISTPVGMVSAITAATRKGVLIKGSSYIEEMRNIKAVIFDKTGTLTEGKLELSEIKIIDNNYSEEKIVSIAASLEHQSSHPIAQAIINHATTNNIKYTETEDFKNITGKGIIGTINNEKYYAANESLIEGSNFEISQEELNNYSKEGKTVIFIGNSEKLLAIITVSDKIRDNAKDVISDLNQQGIQTVMLTGDNKLAANNVANEIGIKYVYSNLLPEDKLNMLDTIRNKFGEVAMVGDGINDAPALARANIGIAMGAAGSDVAIETADIALMQDDISKLPYLLNLSNKTMRIIKENISLAIIIKFLFVILAILGLVTLMMSVGIGDLGLTLLVILNSFRIGMVKDPLF